MFSHGGNHKLAEILYTLGPLIAIPHIGMMIMMVRGNKKNEKRENVSYRKIVAPMPGYADAIIEGVFFYFVVNFFYAVYLGVTGHLEILPDDRGMTLGYRVAGSLFMALYLGATFYYWLPRHSTKSKQQPQPPFDRLY